MDPNLVLNFLNLTTTWYKNATARQSAHATLRKHFRDFSAYQQNISPVVVDIFKKKRKRKKIHYQIVNQATWVMAQDAHIRKWLVDAGFQSKRKAGAYLVRQRNATPANRYDVQVMPAGLGPIKFPWFGVTSKEGHFDQMFIKLKESFEHLETMMTDDEYKAKPHHNRTISDEDSNGDESPGGDGDGARNLVAEKRRGDGYYFTAEEDAKLMQLKAAGKTWDVICFELGGRSRIAVQARFKQIKDGSAQAGDGRKHHGSGLRGGYNSDEDLYADNLSDSGEDDSGEDDGFDNATSSTRTQRIAQERALENLSKILQEGVDEMSPRIRTKDPEMKKTQRRARQESVRLKQEIAHEESIKMARDRERRVYEQNERDRKRLQSLRRQNTQSGSAEVYEEVHTYIRRPEPEYTFVRRQEPGESIRPTLEVRRQEPGKSSRPTFEVRRQESGHTYVRRQEPGESIRPTFEVRQRESTVREREKDRQRPEKEQKQRDVAQRQREFETLKREKELKQRQPSKTPVFYTEMTPRGYVKRRSRIAQARGGAEYAME